MLFGSDSSYILTEKSKIPRGNPDPCMDMDLLHKTALWPREGRFVDLAALHDQSDSYADRLGIEKR